jgi:hypothetical protein
MRAVGNLEVLVPLAAQVLKPNGTILLWLTHDQAAVLPAIEGGLTWNEPLPIPRSRTAEVWRGTKPA